MIRPYRTREIPPEEIAHRRAQESLAEPPQSPATTWLVYGLTPKERREGARRADPGGSSPGGGQARSFAGDPYAYQRDVEILEVGRPSHEQAEADNS